MLGGPGTCVTLTSCSGLREQRASRSGVDCWCVTAYSVHGSVGADILKHRVSSMRQDSVSRLSSCESYCILDSCDS